VIIRLAPLPYGDKQLSGAAKTSAAIPTGQSEFRLLQVLRGVQAFRHREVIGGGATGFDANP
jgi:hypothetical protein